MEYLIGSMITFLALFVASKFYKRDLNNSDDPGIMYTQSYIFTLLSPVMPTNRELKYLALGQTQSQKYEDSLSIKIALIDDKAYWIHENALYEAPVEDGEILKDLQIKVDTMSMSKVQLDKMVFIVDKLTEGMPNDSGNSRN